MKEKTQENKFTAKQFGKNALTLLTVAVISFAITFIPSKAIYEKVKLPFEMIFPILFLGLFCLSCFVICTFLKGKNILLAQKTADWCGSGGDGVGSFVVGLLVFGYTYLFFAVLIFITPPFELLFYDPKKVR